MQAKAVEAEKLRRNLKIANENVRKLNTAVERLKNEVLNAKTNRVEKYKRSHEYQMTLGYAVAMFLTKEKIKMRRIL